MLVRRFHFGVEAAEIRVFLGKEDHIAKRVVATHGDAVGSGFVRKDVESEVLELEFISRRS